MPHKDRAARLAYLREWKAKGGRPSPAPEPQPDARLPPRGAMVFSADGAKVQCHACGRWFGALNMHLRTHGLDADAYKELYGLGRTHSLLPPVTQERYRAATIARDQGAIGKTCLPHGGTGRPKGLTPRLAVRAQASAARKGRYTHGGAKTQKTPPPG